ncbi:MAG: ATP-binding protein [Bacteroidales bacterium]|nr:ATP-binding protein [Bacteroidales bacterium]
MHKKECILILISYFTIALAFCQENKYVYEKFTIENGLSNNTVYDIIQDSDGLMWFATKEGINSFDGYNFQKYIQPIGTNFKSNSVHTIHEYKDQIWCGTWNDGVHIFDKKTFTFKRFCFKSKEKYSFKFIRTISKDSRAHVWIASVDKGLFEYNPNNDSIFCHNSYLSHISNNKLNSLCFISDSTLVIGNQDPPPTYYIEYNIFNHNTRKIHFNGNSRIYHTWDIQKHKNHLYSASRGGGVVIFNPHKENDWKVITSGEGLIFPNIRTIAIRRNGDLWAGSAVGISEIKNGFMNSDPEIINHTSKSNSSFHPNVRSTFSLLADKSDNVWIGTDGGGINYIDFKRHKFQACNSIYYQGWNDFKSSFIAPTSKNELLIGGHSNIFNIDTKSLLTDPLNKNHLYNILKNNAYTSYDCFHYNDYIVHIASFSFGNLKAFVTDTSLHKVSNIITYTNHAVNGGTQYIKADSNGIFWVGTYHQLHRIETDFDIKKPVSERLSVKVTSLKLKDKTGGVIGSHCAYHTKNNQLWIGCMETGIMRLYLDSISDFNDSIDIIQYHTKNTPQLKANRIYTIYCDSKDLMWFGTANGLVNYNDQSKQFYHIGTQDGLNAKSVFAIEEDNNGTLWLSTNAGIFCYNKNSTHGEQFRSFGVEDGLSGLTYVPNSSCKSSNGLIFFGDYNGFTWFDPLKIKYDSLPPKLKLNDITVYNRTMDNGERNIKLEKLISHDNPHSIDLFHKDYAVRVKFSAIVYSKSYRSKFAYKLKGFDNTWQYTLANNRMAYYNNLKPGSYPLMVKASNSDGFWTKPTNLLTINVIPPWWKTLWFKIFISLFILGSIVLSFSIRLAIIKKQNRILEDKVKTRTKHLYEANNVLNMQATELEEQKEELNMQAEEIKAQNDELHLHKNHLEQLVNDRTSELNDAKIKAEESDRLKTYFLANVSHEIRTPMNAIRGFVDLLSIKKDEQVRKRYFKIISENTDYLMHLIDDILDISMIDANELKLNQKDVNLTSFLQSLRDIFQSMVENSKKVVKFNMVIPEKPATVRFDEVRFQQVLTNLVRNAVNFTFEGEITIGYQYDNSSMLKDMNLLTLYVSDTGIGIPKDQLPNIYDAFRQGISEMESPSQGLGLGLSIVKGIVDLHGYAIEVSTQQNKGTQFNIYIPLEETI